jgi:hypothetical protein
LSGEALEHLLFSGHLLGLGLVLVLHILLEGLIIINLHHLCHLLLGHLLLILLLY